MAKRRSKRVQGKVEATFQDETQNFTLPAELARKDPKIAATELAFVNLTSSSGPTQDADKRKLVRAHVMREFQREKQQQEQKAFEQWKEQSQRDTGMHVSSVQRIHDLDAAEIDQWATTEAGLQMGYDYDQWSAILPYQPYPEQGGFNQEIGNWTPGSILTMEHEATPSGDAALATNDQNMGFNVHANTIAGQVPEFSGSLLYEDEEQSEDMIPEQVECHLISDSIQAVILDSRNFSAIDPFNSMPGLRNSRAQAIMYHYNKVLITTLISVVDPESRWFNYATTDSALFHGTMLHSAAHNAMLSGNTDFADPAVFKWEATRLVNERLGDSVLSISDLTMGAVVCLVLFENQAGNIEVSNIHMNGLRRMIKLRGGIQNLGLAGVLKRKILWADLCNATLTYSKPRFNLPSEAYNHQPPLSKSRLPSKMLLPPIHISNGSCSCDKALPEVLTSLRQLSNTVSHEDQPKRLIVDEIYAVERRLVTLLSFNFAKTQPCPSQSVNQPAFLACVIYIYIFLRDFPLRSPLFGHLVERLSLCLFDRDDGGLWQEKDYPMLLWILVIGALVSEGRCERDRFMGDLRKVCVVLGVKKFDEFEGCLKGIAWLERRVLESAVRSSNFLNVLWVDVEFGGVGEMVD